MLNQVAINSMTEWNKKDRVIDIDNLQGICIYIVFSMKQPLIVTEFFLVRDFLSKNVKLSSRSIFLNVLKGGIDYLLSCIEADKESSHNKSEFFESII